MSIVIPLYNKKAWVRRALDSIVKQSFGDFEVLVVDDGSTDGGGRVVADYGDARFRLIAQANAGPGAARNRGIAEAKGDLIAFLDADDEWLPTYIESSVSILDSLGKEVASVSSGYVEYPSGASCEAMWRARGITEGPFRLHANTPPLEAVYRLAYMSPCSTIVRSRVVKKWGGFYSHNRCLYAEDAYLWLKVLLNERVAFHLDATVSIHGEASELSRNKTVVRPLEPFLLDSREIETACPMHLRNLLSNMLAIRAFKTACVLGYWGQWREARRLRKQFTVPRSWTLPYYLSSLICSTPIGACLGWVSRALYSSGKAE